MFEDAVVEGNRGRHTEREEVDGPDHGRHNEGEDYRGVNQEIEVVTVCLINIETENINIITDNGLVADCWRRRESSPVLFHLPLFLCGPVTEPDVRGGEKSLAEEVHHHTEDESREAASTGEISGVDCSLH